MARNYFNTKASIQASRDRREIAREIERARIEESCKPDLERQANASKLAELLATQVTNSFATRKPEEKFEVSIEEVDKKLTIHQLTSEPTAEKPQFEISEHEISHKLMMLKVKKEIASE